MAKIFDKVKDLLLGPEEYDDFEGYDEYGYETETPVKETFPREVPKSGDVMEFNNNKRTKNTSQVVSIHTNVQMQVVIIKPECYEDAQEICDQIKGKKPVVINLEKVEYPIAQRIMDFLSGTCYSLDGTIQRVANNIFIIAPENVDISGDFKEELKTKGAFRPWASSAK